MKKLLLLAVLALAACTPKPPPKPPEPPPPVEPTVQFADMTLRQVPGGTGLVTVTGAPVPFLGAIPCCMEFEGGPTGWPMFSRDWVDYTRLQTGGKARFFHLRVGPFLQQDESEFAAVGHAPYVEVGGKADLDRFDPVFWDHAAGLIKYVGSLGGWVEVATDIGWGCKPGGYPHHPWSAEWNVQGEDTRGACGNNWNARHELFVRQMVKTLGRFGNVVWLDGNEIGSLPVYKAAYSLAMRDVIRDEEAKNGYPVHLFGSNGETDEVESSPKVDFIARHERAGLDGPRWNKWTWNNERNPAFTCDQEHALYCSAQAGGAAWWYWRSEQTKAEMDCTLAKMAGGCGGFNGDSCPFEVPAVAWVQAKVHHSQPGQLTIDATPLVTGAQYCRKIGFSDGRSTCPVRVEGDPFRAQCEIAAMGGEIAWSVTAPLQINGRQGNFQALVTGPAGASGTVSCSTPSGGECRKPAAQGGGPLVVTIP